MALEGRLGQLGRVGIWTIDLDARPGAEAERYAQELEALGYRALWIPEAAQREVLTHATALLSATSTLAVATGIARIHARTPQATVLAQRFLAERHPDRFLLGLGVSHQQVIEQGLHQRFERPLATMRAYLDSMDATGGGSTPASPPPRILAALGPRMLQLAAERADGAHTYLSPVAHTAWARKVLGPHSFLAVSVKAVLGGAADGRSLARAVLARPLRLPSYAQNLERFGLGLAELAEGPSDRVINALVAVGDVDTAVERVQAHLDAGADHVCIEVLSAGDQTVPVEAWRQLAPAMNALG